MTYYPDTTLLPPSHFTEIDHIIFRLWDNHLELAIACPVDSARIRQNLEVISVVINYWEEKLLEINHDEIKQRRSNSNI